MSREQLYWWKTATYENNTLFMCRLRPYHVENTTSRLICQVKQRWAWLVLVLETASNNAAKEKHELDHILSNRHCCTDVSVLYGIYNCNHRLLRTNFHLPTKLDQLQPTKFLLFFLFFFFFKFYLCSVLFVCFS